ncbi:MAG: 50S ribosomal protein L1 [bacterium]
MSKRMKALIAKIDANKVYSVEEAIKLAKETSNVKFDASLEVHVRLGINPKKTDQQIRSNAILPHGPGKIIKVAAFVMPDKAKEAKDAGADFVYDEEDIKKIKETGKIEFDIAVTTPDMMPKMAQVAKVLGPRGLMPNAKSQTVGPNVKQMIEDLKKGKINFKNDDNSNVHQTIGKVSFTEQQLMENFESFYSALKKAKPNGSKGTFIKSMSMCTSMGPSIKITTN